MKEQRETMYENTDQQRLFAFLEKTTHLNLQVLIDCASKYLVSYEDAQDAALIGLWKAFNKVHTFSDSSGSEGKMLAWLKTIVSHTAIDMSRGQKHRSEMYPADINEVLELAKAATQTQVPSAEMVVITQELGTILLQTTELLPAKQRTIVVLFYWQGWKVEAISKQLELSENTVRTILRRSRQKMRAVLEAQGYPTEE